jgi:hypothetical protein
MAPAPRAVQAVRVAMPTLARPLSFAALTTLGTLALVAHADPPAAAGAVTITCPAKLLAYGDTSTAFTVHFAEAALTGAAYDAKARSLQCTYGPSPASGLVTIEQNVPGTGCTVQSRNKVVCGTAAPVALPNEILPVKSPAQPGWSVLYGMLSIASVDLKPSAANATTATATYKTATYARATQVLPATYAGCALADATRGAVTCSSKGK